MDNELLRKQTKLLKALRDVSYSELAEKLEMSRSSFSNWLNRKYDFGPERAEKLGEIVEAGLKNHAANV